MTDTKPNVDKMMSNMLKRKTGIERLKMGFSMFDMAKRLVIASILSSVGNNDVEMRQRLFLRFYRDDFDIKTTNKILTKIHSKTV